MFIDSRELSFIADLTAAWRDIREECLALKPDAFDPWVQREMYGEGWSVYGLHAFGRPMEHSLRACPRTAAALAAVPRLTTAGFSRMTGGTHIKPHTGWVRTVYRAHLGLVVREGCELRVGEETRRWEEGRCLIFDDTVEHEAWNRSAHDRLVLLFDFVRPGLGDVPLDEPPPEVQKFIRAKAGASR